MSDLSQAIQPKADQLTADDLLAGPLTIQITSVTVAKTPEQPVAISFDGDGGKPWKPCKSMTRVLVNVWGPDSSQFAGRRVTLCRDPTVKWGGLEVGGIRISHLSHINGPSTMALTVTRGSKKPFTVKPLAEEKVAVPASDPIIIIRDRLASCEDAAAVLKVGDAWRKTLESRAAAGKPVTETIAVVVQDLIADRYAYFQDAPVDEVPADAAVEDV